MGKRYVAPNVVDGCRHPADIAKVFAGKLAEACMPNSISKYTELNLRLNLITTVHST